MKKGSGASTTNCLSCTLLLSLNPLTNSCDADCPSKYYSYLNVCINVILYQNFIGKKNNFKCDSTCLTCSGSSSS